MTLKIRPYKDLLETNVEWLVLKDHFIATVGENSGKGRPLKNILVIADARFRARSTFPMHPHKDMEILTWVVEGALHHQDDKKSDQFVPTNNLQLMSARDGIYHAEGNSSDKPLRILQIWIRPSTTGGTPSVLQIEHTKKGFALLAAPKDAPFTIRQDCWLYAGIIDGVEKFEIPVDKFGYAVFIGDLKINETQLQDGDGVELSSGKYSIEGLGQIILILQDL